MRILHYSDPHLPPHLASVPIADWPSKRLTGALSHLFARRRRFHSARHKVERLARFALDQRIDLVLCTGDHTVLGTNHELAEARRVIEPLTRVPMGLITVPGNHDLYAPDAARERRFDKHFGDLLHTDLPGCSAEDPWPLVRLAGDEVAVVAVSSSLAHCAPWRASGRVPPAQLETLRSVLHDERLQGRFMLVMTHHAPLLEDGGRDRADHGLTNADALLEACAGMSRGCVLFGHVHRTYLHRPSGHPATLLNAGSATLAGHEGLWVLDIGAGAARATRGRWSEGGYVLDQGSSHDIGL